MPFPYIEALLGKKALSPIQLYIIIYVAIRNGLYVDVFGRQIHFYRPIHPLLPKKSYSPHIRWLIALD